MEGQETQWCPTSCLLAQCDPKRKQMVSRWWGYTYLCGVHFNTSHCDKCCYSHTYIWSVFSRSWRSHHLWLLQQGASHILSTDHVNLLDSQVSGLQVFSFSAGPGCQTGRALGVSLMVITHPNPFINTPKLAMWGTCSDPCLFFSSWTPRSAMLSTPAVFVQRSILWGKLFFSRRG